MLTQPFTVHLLKEVRMNLLRLRYLMCVALFALGLSGVSDVHAQVSQRTIRYDGRLEQNGVAADGRFDLGFALFDSATGGQQLWPALAGSYSTLSVAVSNGVFVVELGGQGMESLNWRVFAASQVYVQTKVNESVLTGRRSIGAVPFAVVAQNGVPVGSVQAYMGVSEFAPAGWLYCDGRSYNSADYPELAAALGATGATFTVPDLRGRFLRGLNDMDGVGLASPRPASLVTYDQDDRRLGDLQNHTLQSHQHGPGNLSGATNTTGNHSHTTQRWVGQNGTGNPDGSRDSVEAGHPGSYPRQSIYNPATTTNGNHSHSVTITAGQTAVFGNAETRPVNIAVKYIIKK